MMTANPTVLDILDPRTDALIRAIIEGFTDVSGKFIAARYPPRDVAPQHAQLDSDDTTPAQALQGHGDAGNGADNAIVTTIDYAWPYNWHDIGPVLTTVSNRTPKYVAIPLDDAPNSAENAHGDSVSVTDGEGVNGAVNPDVNPESDALDWLSDFADAQSVNVVNAMLPKPVNGREKRLSRLRQPAADTSPEGTGGVGVRWVDGELDKVLTLSKERQRVWRWLKGLTVTPSEPSCWDAAAETGISQQTANKAIRQYRDFHGIF